MSPSQLIVQVVAAMCSKVPFISSAIMKATDSGMYLWLTAITIMTVLSSSFFLFFLTERV